METTVGGGGEEWGSGGDDDLVFETLLFSRCLIILSLWM